MRNDSIEKRTKNFICRLCHLDSDAGIAGNTLLELQTLKGRESQLVIIGFDWANSLSQNRVVEMTKFYLA